MYKIIALVGKSGSGKDRLLKELIATDLDNNFHEIVSNTTRPIRENEVDGVNYHYISDKDFIYKDKNGEMIESSCFRGWYYGTSYDNLDENKINIGVYNPTGYMTLLKNKNVDVLGVMIDCSDKERLIRQLNRETSPDVDEIIRRYSTDKNDFKYLYDYLNLHYPQAYQVRVNNDKGTDINIITQLIKGYIKTWENNGRANK